MSTISENAKAIFLEAVEQHAPEAWPNFLDQACGEDRDLRGMVEGLLLAHAEKDSLFDRVGETRDYQPIFRAGQAIGPYQIREQIGDGGMGVVYVAEQEKPLRRKVALKVIKPGMDSKAVLARFDAERNALALMNHPNIAKVLDAGTTEQGHPYFVMELIQGKLITEYCDQKKLTIPERLDLFTQICNAVQHAHSKGVIHRDIKPSNILVTEIDGKPVPKVIDFGVAKALGANLTDRTIYSSFQSLVGTPLYMSPEQTQLSGVDVDTSSDVYSLGILLYELLTGTTPLSPEELRQAAQDEVLRRIRETEPPRPSNRISALGETSSQVSECRGAQPEQLGRLVRGDLDWIVLKALEKDRNRRYKTADAFAADIGRHLTNEPVEARPPSMAYRLSCFYGRNRFLVGTLTAICIMATISGFGMAMAWREATRERDRYASLLNDTHNLIIDKMLHYAFLGDAEEVDPLAHQARELGVPSDLCLTLQGAARLHSGDNEAARELLVTALRENESNVAAEAMLLIAYYHDGDTELWRQHVTETINRVPRSDPEYADLDALFLGYAKFYVNFRESADELEGLLEKRPNWLVPRAILAAAQGETANSHGDMDYLHKAFRSIEGPRAVASENRFVLVVQLFLYKVALRLGEDIDHGDAEEVVRLLASHEDYRLANMMRAEYLQFTDENSPREREAWEKVLNDGTFFASYAIAALYARKDIERVRDASVNDPESRIARAMVLASLPNEKERARRVYDDLRETESSWNIRYQLLQLILLLRDFDQARSDCIAWLAEDRAIIRDVDSLFRKSMELIAGTGEGPSLQAESPHEQFRANYIRALRAYCDRDFLTAQSYIAACTQIRTGCLEMFWAEAFEQRWPVAASGEASRESSAGSGSE